MTTPDQPPPVRRGHRALRLTLIGLAVVVATLLVASTFISGR